MTAEFILFTVLFYDIVCLHLFPCQDIGSLEDSIVHMDPIKHASQQWMSVAMVSKMVEMGREAVHYDKPLFREFKYDINLVSSDLDCVSCLYHTVQMQIPIIKCVMSGNGGSHHSVGGSSKVSDQI